MLDGTEITQFTYFQQVGGMDLSPISCEITYGMERIAMFLQKVDNVFDVEWGGGKTYGDVRHARRGRAVEVRVQSADRDRSRALLDLSPAHVR